LEGNTNDLTRSGIRRKQAKEEFDKVLDWTAFKGEKMDLWTPINLYKSDKLGLLKELGKRW
jgi:hypothetical protein